MAKLYNNPNVESENWKIRTFTIKYPDHYRAILNDGIIPGTYVSLTCKNPKAKGLDSDCTCMMSDTPMEKFTNQEFLNIARGTVLIAGLGIGMLPAALAEKDNVESITIIEYDQEIIDLVEPLIRQYVKNQEKIKIIKANAYTYPKENPNVKYDFIWIDIWEDFHGYYDELDTFEQIIDDYIEISNHPEYVSAWGYREAFEGANLSPIEDSGYPKYIAQMLEWEARIGELDDNAVNGLCNAITTVNGLGVDLSEYPKIATINGTDMHLDNYPKTAIIGGKVIKL